ncbi:MAG: hypothetical protein ABFD89_18540 [Bryobacteraceae bacterium]
MKYVALGLLVAGLLLIGLAFRKDSRSSFEDGSFLGQILLAAGGVVCLAAAIGIFAVRIFMAL